MPPERSCHQRVGSSHLPREHQKPSWDGKEGSHSADPSQPPSTARSPHPAKATGRVWSGAGGPQAGLTTAFPQTGWFHGVGRLPAGPSQNQPIRYSPDLRLGFTATVVPGQRGEVLKHSQPAAPALPSHPPAMSLQYQPTPELWYQSSVGDPSRYDRADPARQGVASGLAALCRACVTGRGCTGVAM